MTTNYHTPLSTGAPANASTVNNPLGQLDSTLTTTNINLTAVTNDVADLTSDLATTDANLATVTSDVAGLTTDLASTDATVATLTSGLATTNSNLTTVASDVADLTSDLATTDANLATVTSGLTTTNTTVATLTSGLATTNSNLTAVTTDVADLTTDLATTDTNLTSITNALNILKSGFIGMIFASATGTAPTGMLPCDGSIYNQSAYPDLYATIASEFKTGLTNQFRTPDLRGRTVIGSGTGASLTARTINQSGGTETHPLTVSEMPAHNHLYAHPVGTSGSGYGLVDGLNNTSSLTPSTQNKGGGQAHNNMQPFSVLNYWIVATL